MSVLLDLPNELFYNIVHEWIDPQLFLVLSLLDNALKYSSLRIALLNHFDVMKNGTHEFGIDIRFDWNKGFHVDELKFELFTFYLYDYFSCCEGLSLAVNRIDISTDRTEWLLTFINCCKVKELDFHYCFPIRQIADKVLNSLEGLRISGFRFEKNYEDLEHIKNCCRNLIKLNSECNPITNEIVRNNAHLEDLHLCGNSNIFDIITANCKKLRRIGLFNNFSEEMTVKNIFNLISTLKWLIKIDLNGKFTCNWERYKTPTFTWKSKVEWTIKSAIDIDKMLSEIVNYFYSSTRSITITGEQLSISDQPLSVQALQSVLLRCSCLYFIEIFHFMNPSAQNMAECFKFVKPTLCMLSLGHIDMRTIIQILKYCRTFHKVFFRNVYDSMTNIEIKAEFQRTIREYSNKNLYGRLRFAKNPQKFLTFNGGVFEGNLLHFLGPVKGIPHDDEVELDD